SSLRYGRIAPSPPCTRPAPGPPSPPDHRQPDHRQQGPSAQRRGRAMGKFAKLAAGVASAVTAVGRGTTHEGGAGYVRDAKSELFLLAVTNMVAEDTFYEKGADRDRRFAALVTRVTQEDPDWVARFVPWLRNTAQMRSASVVMACEYVHAGGPNGRRVIAAACARADEPAEVLAYWRARYGRNLPQPVKRGVADAARRLYTQRAALKYDGTGRPWRMADVLELAHVRPADDAQAALFGWLLARRHNRPDAADPASVPALPVVREWLALQATPVAERRVDAGKLAAAGMTWEATAGWRQGAMDATTWSALTPSMGYMALLRNLRNFDQAGVSDQVAAMVAARLADPEQVARSRQLPFRFWSAYKS